MKRVTYSSCNVKNVKLNLMVVAVLIVRKFIHYQLMSKKNLEKGKETVIKFLKKGDLPTKYKMSNRFKILISSLILVIASCGDNNTVFLDYQDVDGVWKKQNDVKFSFNSDKESITDISLLLRTDSSYPFSNIYVITSIKNNDRVVFDTINYSFKDSDNKWYNFKSSRINNSKIIIKEKFKILPGKFEFGAKHAIRYLDSITPQIKLDGILDVGLMVENSIK